MYANVSSRWPLIIFKNTSLTYLHGQPMAYRRCCAQQQLRAMNVHFVVRRAKDRGDENTSVHVSKCALQSPTQPACVRTGRASNAAALHRARKCTRYGCRSGSACGASGRPNWAKRFFPSAMMLSYSCRDVMYRPRPMRLPERWLIMRPLTRVFAHVARKAYHARWRAWLPTDASQQPRQPCAGCLWSAAARQGPATVSPALVCYSARGRTRARNVATDRARGACATQGPRSRTNYSHRKLRTERHSSDVST
jgi:hypothetical protein